MTRIEFVYREGHPSGRHETAVRDAGYPWVRTNALRAGDPDHDIDLADPDRLLKHSHHGINTHRIVEGDLTIVNAATGVRTEISKARGVRRDADVGAGEAYSGETRNGCSFVEGHRKLSPRTAERFIARGTLRIDAKGVRDSRAVPDEDTVRKWLREVTFNPRGKAFPNAIYNEKPVLEFLVHSFRERYNNVLIFSLQKILAAYDQTRNSR